MEWVRMDNVSKIKTDLLMREWAEMVRECRSSGLTVKEWCINMLVSRHNILCRNASGYAEYMIKWNYNYF